MDISEFLASMQPDASSRALSRIATKPAIPDPNAQQDTGAGNPSEAADDSMAMGALPEPDAGQGQDMSSPDQGFEKGGAVDDEWSPDSPESENIEDRRGNDKSIMKPGSKTGGMTFGSPLVSDVENGVSGVTSKVSSYAGARTTGKNYAEGGEVEGAIPDDQPEQQQEQPQAQGDDQGNADNWRQWAQEAVDAGVQRTHEKFQPNQGMGGGEDDPEHSGRVRAMLTGEGSLSAAQWSAAEQMADPEGSMDPASKQMAALGKMYQFYKDKDPDQAAEAAHGAIQHFRKRHNMLAAAASAAVEHGNSQKAAELGSAALNSVPDGIHTQIKVAGGDDITGEAKKKSEVRGPLGYFGDIIKGANSRVGRGKQPAVEAPETAPAAGGEPAEAPAPEPKKPAGGPNTTPSTFNVSQIDPESGKTVLATDLTQEQFHHLMAGHFDLKVHRGTPTAVGEASQVPEGQGRHVSGQQQQQSQPWMIGGVDTRGMWASEIAELRRSVNAQAPGHANQMELERMKQEGSTGREGMKQTAETERHTAANTSAESRAQIAAGNDPKTGQPLRNDPTGRNAQFAAAQERNAMNMAKSEWDEGGGKPTAHGKTRDEVLDWWRNYYNRQTQQRPGGAGGAGGGQPPQPGQKTAPAQYENGRTYQMNGKQYRYNEAKGMFDPI